jgi:hypothetical protein
MSTSGLTRRDLVKHGLLLLVLAPTTVLLFSAMKLIPQLVAIGLFAMYAVLHAVVRAERSRRALAVPLLVVLFLAASWTIGVQGALWISPPRTPDGHPVMAIGQLFLGSVVAVLAAGVWCYVYFRRWIRNERLEAISIHVVGAALAVVLALRLLRGL